MYYVYLLESLQDNSWYIGYTPDSPFTRLEKHNSATEYYTKRKIPWKLIYFEAYFNQKDATSREKFLKSGAGRIFLKKQIKNYLLNRLAACKTVTRARRVRSYNMLAACEAIRGPIV